MAVELVGFSDCNGPDAMSRMALRQVADALCQATTLSNTGHSPQVALSGILEQLHRVIACDRASIAILEKKGWQTVVGCAFSPNTNSSVQLPGEQPVTLDAACAGAEALTLDLVWRARETLVISDLASGSMPCRPGSPRGDWGGEPSAALRAEPGGRTSTGRGSWLGTPVLARGQVLGVLSLIREQPGPFSSEEAQLAAVFASQAAVVLDGARPRSGQDAGPQLQSIPATGATLSAEMNPDTLPDQIVAEAAKAFQAEATSLMLWNEDESAMVIRASHGLSPRYVREQRIPRERVESSFPADGPGLLYIPNLSSSPLGSGALVAGEELCSVLTAALVRQRPTPAGRADLGERCTDRITGILNIYSKGRQRTFGRPEIELVYAFAAQASIAIENARLYRQVSHHLEEVQILNQVAVAATSTLHFDEVIRRSIAALLGKRNFERANILLLDEVHQDLWLDPALTDVDVFPQRANFRIPVQQGITGWCVRHNRSARVDDVRQDPRYVAGYPDTLSEMCVPLRSGEHVIGVLDVQSVRPHAFVESDERLLTTLASQLSTIIENSRLFAEAQQRVRELTALTQVSQAINRAEGLDTVMRTVLDEALNLLGGQEASIILLDPPGSDRLRIVAERGLGPEIVQAFNSRPVFRHEGTYRRALQQGEIVEIADTSTDPDFLTDVGSRARSLSNVPLLSERGTIGLIAVDGVARDERTRRLLLTLAGMAAVAIDRESLHKETADRLAEVSTLYTLATEIARSLSLSSVLETIVTVLRLTLDCRSCSIFLLDETGQYLQLEAGSGPSSAWKGIARMRLGEGASGRAVAERRSIYVPDTSLEADFLFFDPQIRSLLVVPLIVRNKPIGTLSIDDVQPHAFDEEVRLLTIAATQAAIAIANVGLYESLQKSYADMERAYDELRQLDKMRSELIQNISHELRTPLTFIKGYVELLQDGEMGHLEPEQRAALNIVATKAEGLSRLVDDIIFMQHAGRQQMQFAPHSLAALARLATQAAQASAQEAGIILRSEVEEVPWVMGDWRRLGQVLDNLIQNAIKFSDPGGQVVVRARPDESMSTSSAARVRVEVQDWGIGIAKEQQDRIWERFYQVDGTTSRRFGGTGLGLAIVKQIVQAHGGFVGVESEPQKGSLFYFAIPAIGANREQGG